MVGIRTPKTPYGAFLHGPNPNSQVRKFYKKHCDDLGKFEIDSEEIQAKRAKLDESLNQSVVGNENENSQMQNLGTVSFKYKQS